MGMNLWFLLGVGFLLTLNRSGMCKAGFAGDDAPRAVFRKSPSYTPAIVFVV